MDEQPIVDEQLKFVGRIVAPTKETGDLSLQGANAQAHVFDEYADALDDIEERSHIWLLCWLHEAARDRLKVIPKRVKSATEPKGVFALRSPVRPNPIGLTAAKLIKREGNILYLDHVDFIDGTPIIDIKPYSVGWDAIFSAKNNSGYDTYRKMPVEQVYDDMLRQAANFHGDCCIGVTIGMRAAHVAMKYFKCDLQDKSLKIEAGVRGCIADAIQGLTQAGGKRLRRPEPLGETVAFIKDGERLELEITRKKFDSVRSVLEAADGEIFKNVDIAKE